MLGGKPSEMAWGDPETLPPSLRGWMGYEQKNFMNVGIQPIPLHVRQPHKPNWSDWRRDLMTYSELLLQGNADHTALIGQSAGATALLWLMTEYAGFGVEKFIMVDPWKPTPGSSHTEFRRSTVDLRKDHGVFRQIGELILVISSDDDAQQPEVVEYTQELIRQVAVAKESAEAETIQRGLEEPIITATITVLDMLGRGHFIQNARFPEMTDILTAQNGQVGPILAQKYGATFCADGTYQLAIPVV